MVDIFTAVRLGMTHVVTPFFKDWPSVVQQRVNSGETLLHLAMKPWLGAPSLEIINALVEAGADLDAVDNHGKTPRYWMDRSEWFCSLYDLDEE